MAFKKKTTKVQIITTDWLIEELACVGGVNWFRRKYKNGLKITKKNIADLITQLLERRERFAFSLLGGIKEDTFLQMGWLISTITKRRRPENKWRKFQSSKELKKHTAKEMANKWWEFYREANKRNV